MSRRLTISILIPCHNEEKMISACIDACLAQTRSADKIIVVNDGSIDKTGDILRSYGEKIEVVTTPLATGNKSYAQELGLQCIDTDVFIATDGDTLLDRHFVERIEHDFQEDESIAAVSGYVKSMPHNYITAYREIEYAIGQDVHKTAQACLGFLLVIPGCAGAFKTAIFRSHINFDHDTLTEDLDFTYKLHQAGLRIKYDPKAISYTQDPATLSSYINQMRRWYSGGWQNLRKHYNIVEHPNAALELSLTYMDGMFFSALFFFLPIISVAFFLKLLLVNAVVCVALGTYAAIMRQRIDLFFYSFLGTLFTSINGWVFLEQFVLEIVMRKRNLEWFHPERRAMRSPAL